MSRTLVTADAAAGFDTLAQRLADRAEALATARAAERALAARGEESGWRRADLVWPLFTKG